MPRTGHEEQSTLSLGSIVYTTAHPDGNDHVSQPMGDRHGRGERSHTTFSVVVHARDQRPEQGEPRKSHSARHRPRRGKGRLQQERNWRGLGRKLRCDRAAKRVPKVRDAIVVNVQLTGSELSRRTRVARSVLVRWSASKAVVPAQLGKQYSYARHARGRLRPRDEKTSEICVAMKGNKQQLSTADVAD